MDFNQSKENYREMIEDSIRFGGKDHDFYIDVKADFLNRAVKQFLPHVSNPRLLDIGCGHGYIHNRLHQKGFDVVGVDMAAEVLELAQEANPGVKYLSHDGKSLPFDSGTFDVALAICVMHHVLPSQWNDFLIEMKRVLKPGGIGVIFEHNPYNPLTRMVVARTPFDFDAVLLSKGQMEKLIRDSGFKRAQSRFILFTPLASSIFRWMDRKLGWCPLGAQYYTVAVK